MTVAFMCPSDFDNYDMVEKELNKIKNITKLTCATTNTYELLKQYSDKYKIELYKEERGKKIFNLRLSIQCADKVLIFKKSILDPDKYSRTQKAIGFAKDLKKDTILITYD
ncbi:MAG: hypothetical protein U9Q20_02700 [Campylobacterota bacterium]|nr:hypothetical protein [Campylobacterota bacterium]